MSKKNKVEVIIQGKSYTLSGSESETYLLSVARYIDDKINSLKKFEGYRQLDKDYRNLLLNLNLSDDYLKAKENLDLLEIDVMESQIRIEELEKELGQAKARLEALERRKKK